MMTADPATAQPSRSHRPMYIGLAIVGAAVLFIIPRAAVRSADGNWGGAIGLLIGPFVWYAIIQFVTTLIGRKLLGRTHTRFATSRLNYATAALIAAAVLGAAAQTG